MTTMNKRTVREISPQKVTKLWNECLLNALVVISLFFQMVLLLLGSRRKYIPRIWLKLIVWVAYTPADRIATASIGLLTNCQAVCEDNPSQKIRAFWAPFLLLHLGGPDTITAYSSDDNELWRRHLLGLLMHSAWALYNFEIRSWKGTPLNLIAIPMFVAGFIKYGERTWFLLSGSNNKLKKSVLRHLDPNEGSTEDPNEGSTEDPNGGSTDDGGPTDDGGSPDDPNGGSSDQVPTGGWSWCAAFMAVCDFEKAEGYCVSCQPKSEKCEVVNIPFMAACDFEKAEGYCVSCQPKSEKCEVVNIPSPPPIDKSNKSIPDEALLQKATKFFPKFKRLFTDVVLEWTDVEDSKAFFENISSTEAFRVIEIELGFMYDKLYTKAVAICHTWVVVSRFIYLSSTISTLIGFSIIDKPECAIIEVNITWFLVVGAFVQEVYSIILLCSSDWTMSCFSKQEKTRGSLICQAISSCRVPFLFPENKGWSDSMAQLSLTSYYKNLHLKFIGAWKFSCISHMLEEYYSKNSNVPKYLKRMIFDHIRDVSKHASDVKAAKRFCALRGKWTLQEMKCCCRLGWSIEKEFDESILLWHLATDICYCTDLNKNSIPVDNSNREASKLLSDYMVNLLVRRPSMLPDGIGEIRFQQSAAEAAKVFRSGKRVKDRIQACKKLLQVPPEKKKGDRSKSVLFDACRLALSLQSLETEKEWGCEKKWKTMSHMWVEMLCYAACHCGRNQHAEELCHGGELLTHVWLLMAHFGITEHLTQG